MNIDLPRGKLGLFISHPKSGAMRNSTFAVVKDADGLVVATGHAYCAKGDTFNRRRGVQLAVARALADTNLTKPERAIVWDRVWNGKYADAKQADTYLVMGRSTAVDVPVRSFRTKAGAYAYAAGVTEDEVLEAGARVNGGTVYDVLGVGVVPFRRGVPGRYQTVRVFTPTDLEVTSCA